MGTTFLAKGQYDEAIAEFEQCLKDPVYSTPDKAAYNIGVAYFNKKDIDKAIENYEKAVKLKNDNAGALYNLAFCLQDKKNYAKALEYYKKVVNVDPSFKEAYHRIGLIHEDREEYAKALESLEKATEVDPDYVIAHFRAGSILAKLGEVDKALKKLEVVAKADPESTAGKEAQEKIKGLNISRLSAKPSRFDSAATHGRRNK